MHETFMRCYNGCICFRHLELLKLCLTEFAFTQKGMSTLDFLRTILFHVVILAEWAVMEDFQELHGIIGSALE